MTIDIIIPVHNRLEALIQTLQALNTQSVPSESTPRLIIIDDGSTENIIHAVKETTQRFPAHWHVPIILSQSHKGVAAARNAGLQVATADIIFFLGADIILKANTLQRHIEFHTQHPQTPAAALGFVMWHPLLQPSPFMEYLVHGGPQNDFDTLLGKTTADPKHFFYASHLSLKRALIGDVRFDEQFSTYGWEDFDFGQQLAGHGLQLHVLHQAIGYHNHLYTLENSQRRQQASGASFVLYRHKYPQLTQSVDVGVGRRLKHIVATYIGYFAIIKAIVSLWPNQAFPGLFLHLGSHWFLQGFWHNKDQT